MKKKMILGLTMISLVGCGLAQNPQTNKKDNETTKAPLPDLSTQAAGTPSSEDPAKSPSRDATIPQKELTISKLNYIVQIKFTKAMQKKLKLEDPVVELDLSNDVLYTGTLQLPKDAHPKLVLTKLGGETKEYVLADVKTAQDGKIIAYQGDDRLQGESKSYGQHGQYEYAQIERSIYEISLHTDNRWNASFEHKALKTIQHPVVPDLDDDFTEDDIKQKHEQYKKEMEEFTTISMALFGATLAETDVQTALSELTKEDISQMTPQDIRYVRSHLVIEAKEKK
ncbi:MAG: hypothetical protein HY390_02715 [Deltaproteobacteria bacterium]|nr:hypothetical protein [Deltaproteobacteria bacterium]